MVTELAPSCCHSRRRWRSSPRRSWACSFCERPRAGQTGPEVGILAPMRTIPEPGGGGNSEQWLLEAELPFSRCSHRSYHDAAFYRVRPTPVIRL